MENKYSCFFCRSPYQVLTAITIAMGNNLEYADIYIISEFEGYKSLAQRIADRHIFHDVRSIDADTIKIEYKQTKGIKKIKALFQYVTNLAFLESTVKKYLDLRKDYQDFYMASNSFEGRFALLYYYNMGKEVNLHYFEDGIGSYYNYEHLEKVLLYDRVLRIIFLGGKATHIPYSKLLYNPELYLMIHKKMNIEHKNIISIEKINPLLQCQTTYELIKELFLLNDSKIKEEYIFFDTTRSEDFTKGGIKAYEKILSIINQHVTKNNIIYKYHPREKNVDFTIPHITNKLAPFECYNYYNNFEEKILITGFSTSVFSPKLIFNQEPIIILLYKLLGDVTIDQLTKERDHVVNIFRETYESKWKIIIPSSIDELIQTMDNLAGVSTKDAYLRKRRIKSEIERDRFMQSRQNGD